MNELMNPQDHRKITLIVMWMTTLGQAAVALYLPALPAIAQDLQASPAAIKATITVFLIAFGLSQFVYGPLSDHHGRRPILLIGIFIFCLGCLLNIFAHTTDLFFLARFIQGVGCGSMLTSGRSILRDCFTGRELASAISYASMGFALGFGVTPIIGAYLQYYIAWQADFAFLMLAGATLFVIIWRWMPETGNAAVAKPSPREFFGHTFKAYQLIISDSVFLRFLFGSLFAYSVVVAYNIMTPFLIQDVLGFSSSTYGWLAVCVAIPYYLGASYNRQLVLRFGMRPIVIVGIVMIVVAGLLMIATTLSKEIHLAYVIIPVMMATFGQALIFANAVAGALQNFGADLGGKSSAALSGMQILLTGILSAGMAILPDTTQVSMALVLLFCGISAGIVLWTELRK